MGERQYSRNRQEEIASFISDFRREHGVSPSMQEIADGVGIGKTTVFVHMKNMEKDGLIVKQSVNRGFTTKAPLIEVPEGDIVPIVGRIACGSPILAQEDIEDYVRLPESIFGKGTFFLLRAKGDSMIDAGIDSGDLVLIRQQSTAEPGQIIVALVNDDEEATLKRYYPEPEKRRIRLHPENESMEDIFVEHCTIQGVAVHIDPCKMTLGEWLDIWAKDYLVGVKESTAYTYKTAIKNHIKPAMGAIRLDALNPHTIQSFYNSKTETHSAKTIRNFHGVLHAALKQAVLNGYIATNPADSSVRPRVEKKEMHPMDQYMISDFLEEIKGDEYEHLFFVTLFTGLRKGEVLGLTWDSVDFSSGTLLINKQLQRPREGDGRCKLVTTKNGKARKLKPAKEVMNVLYRVKRQQQSWQLQHGECFQNPMNLVFTHELGEYLNPNTVYNHFKEIVAKIGVPEVRFHDMCHSYAVAALQAGDDVKTVQGNLGHATAAFTLDVYGHVTDQMKEESANRMERFIHSVRSA